MSLKQRVHSILQGDEVKIDLSPVVGHERHLVIKLTNVVQYITAGDGQHDEIIEVGFSFAMMTNYLEKLSHSWQVLKFLDAEFQLTQFEQKYDCNIWQVLTLCYQSQAALDLYKDAPLLFWLTLQHAKNGKWEDEYLLNLYQQKRKDIIQACHLPARRAVLNCLGKIDVERFNRHTLEAIHRFDWQRDVHRLSHQSRICLVRMELVILFPGIERAVFFRDSDARLNREYISYIDDCQKMMPEQFRPRCLPRLNRCQSLTQVIRIHDQLVDELLEQQKVNVRNFNFPHEPVPGNETIVPIKTYRGLLLEGAVQKHCVSGYAEKILEGKYFVYKIIEPERATLGLHLKIPGTPSIDQIRCKRNRAPKPETFLAVNTWLFSNLGRHKQI